MAIIPQFALDTSFSNESVLPDLLRFDRPIREEAKFIRLIFGTSKITDNYSDWSMRQNVNFTILGSEVTGGLSKSLFYRTFDLTDFNPLESYLRSANAQNTQFFKDLICEFCHYFSATKKGNHTIAFLYLYRLLERVAYIFPMIYTAKASNYVSTFTKLQNYFKQAGNNSETDFYQLFIEDSFEDVFLDAPITFSLAGFNEEVKEGYYKTLKSVCDLGGVPILNYTEYSELKISNKHTLKLFVTLRNRFFHFGSGGQKNITSLSLINHDDFFKNVNSHFANWLSLAYVRLITLRLN